MLQNTLVLCILLRTEKWQMLYRQSVWLYAFYKSYISRLRYRYSWVRKVFFSYTDGVKACCRNIRRQWVYEYCSSSCRYFESQIEIVSKVLGSLARVWKECLWTICKMLKLAVIEQDEDAIATLSAIGIIAIDEATYVQAVTVVNDDG
jgi:hypothetical protein